MAQRQSPDDESERERVSATELVEGDTVFMGINLHGLADDYPGVEYDSDIYQSGVEGEVVEALTEIQKEFLADGDRPMADLTVEAFDDDGTRYTWNVDNGYVIGPNAHDEGPKRTDVGKFGGFYE